MKNIFKQQLVLSKRFMIVKQPHLVVHEDVPDTWMIMKLSQNYQKKSNLQCAKDYLEKKKREHQATNEGDEFNALKE